MDIVSKLTMRELTPPGYFNLSEDAPAFHAAYMSWFNSILAARSAQSVALRTLILTPWLVNHQDAPRTPWLDFLLTQNGLGYFGGTNNQAAALYKLVTSAWNRSTLTNMLLVAQTLCLPPFSWFEITSAPAILVGFLLPSVMDTGFLIYSTAGSLPSTPAPTAYLPRAWSVPSSWTRTASSATYYSRGYIVGSTLVWCAPRPVSDFENSAVLSASVPVAVAAVGTLCIVEADGTGDHAVIYYSDGAAWRKNSTPNADLGLVILESSVRPDPEAITVFAPNPATVTYAVQSDNPPPSAGKTQGYGSFATGADTAITTGEEIIQLHQLSGGTVAIATLIDLMRRIKPTGKFFTLNIDGTLYTITDSRQV